MRRTNPRNVDDIKKFNKKPFKEATIHRGQNVIIHSTASLGGSGFTWARKLGGGFLQAHNLGDIVLEDNVKIGEHCTVRRSTLPGTSTSIGRGTVLISYVNVGHNCKIGKNSFLGPHVCLNGSVEIGDDCWIAGHAVVHQKVKIGDGATVGLGSVVLNDVPPGETVVGAPAVPVSFAGNYVHPSFVYGNSLEIGKFNHIHGGVIVGDDCVIRSNVELRKGTVIGDGCYIDSGVKTSGDCVIKDGVTLRYDSIIAKKTIIEPDVFIAPQLMTENISHLGEEVGGAHIGVGDWGGETEHRVFIGTNVTLAAGIEICSGTVIGSKSNVRKSITDPGVYIGNPAKRLER